MSLSKIESSLLQIAQRTISDGSKKAASLGAAGARGLRLVKDYTAGELVLNTLKSNQKSTVNSSASACANAISYLAPALAGLQEQQNLVQNALSLAVRAASDPSVQSVSQLAAMNNQLQQILNQIQNVVNTTQDVNGNDILGYVSTQPLLFAVAAAQYCPQFLQDVLHTAYSIVDYISAAGSITASARVAVNVLDVVVGGDGLIEGSLTDGLYGVVASEIASTNTSLNDAGIALRLFNTNAAPMTITDVCVKAMNIIPTIAFDAATYISQAFYDCKRIEQMSAQLPQLMVSAGVDGGAMAANLLPIKMIAFMTNTAVTSGAGMAHIASGQAEPAGGTAESIAFANLLTPAEKAALISLIATPNAGLDVANIVGGAAGTIKPGAIITALQQITSFANVAAGNNLLTINNSDCIICNASGGGSVAITAATDIGGPIANWCGDGGGFNAILTGFVNGAETSSAQYLVTEYFVNAAVTFINSYMSNMISSGPVVQVGLNIADTMRLNIPNSSIADIGLNISGISIATVVNAQAAVTSLKAAATALSADIASINNQVHALGARIVSLDLQDDVLTDQLGAIENTDLAENADDLAGVNIQNFQAAALVGTQNVIQSTIDNAAQKIMRRAAVGG